MNSAPSDDTATLIHKGQRYFVPNYKPREMILDHGQGSRLWDLEGKEYIDLGAGIAVNALGHQHPALVRALESQTRKLWHTSNIYFTEPAIRLAEALVESCCAERVYFCNSGAEANEAAIKLARKYASLHHPPEKREIISFEGSFHGRTLAAVTATAQPKYHQGFEPLPGGFRYCAFNDIDAVAAMISTERTCAVLVEPVQGEGGVIPADPEYLQALRKLCDAHQALLITDEIQCGMGRIGHFWAHAWAGIEPDVITLAKALGCGVPIGAMMAGKKVAETLQFGSHGSTFGGNPLACAVALAAVQELAKPELLARVHAVGQRLREALENLGQRTGLFQEVRGLGLMLGAVLSEDWRGKAGELSELARQHGVLILQAGPDVLRFLPPLVISDEELDTGLARLAAALTEATA